MPSNINILNLNQIYFNIHYEHSEKINFRKRNIRWSEWMVVLLRLNNIGDSSKENGVWIVRFISYGMTKLLWPLWVNSEYLRIWCISEFTQITNIIIRWTISLISMISLIIWSIENPHLSLKSVNFWSKTYYFWSIKDGIFNGKWGFFVRKWGFSIHSIPHR